MKLQFVARFDRPVDIAARVNDNGIYVAQQSGRVVRYLVNGKSTVTLDLSSLTKAEGERGLLGLVFHPNGKSLFVNYTNIGGDTVVARYAMKPDGTALRSSRVVLFTLRQPYANHNGGGLAFGPNGRLFIGTGDGGSGGDPQRRALDPKSRFGKMLSVNPNATSKAGNDLVVWSRGLRNPWRFEFDAQVIYGLPMWVRTVGKKSIWHWPKMVQEGGKVLDGVPSKQTAGLTRTNRLLDIYSPSMPTGTATPDVPFLEVRASATRIFHR